MSPTHLGRPRRRPGPSACDSGALEPFTYLDCTTYSSSDATKSLWDNGIGSAWNAFNTAGADRIWSTPNPVHPISGDTVNFSHTFTVGWPLGGSPMITADNGYTVSLDGGFVGKAQLGPGFPGTLLETVVPGAPQSGNWGVASQGWQSVETFALSGLTPGANTLSGTAANEYMADATGPSGADFYYAGYDPSGAINPIRCPAPDCPLTAASASTPATTPRG